MIGPNHLSEGLSDDDDDDDDTSLDLCINMEMPGKHLALCGRNSVRIVDVKGQLVTR